MYCDCEILFYDVLHQISIINDSVQNIKHRLRFLTLICYCVLELDIIFLLLKMAQAQLAQGAECVYHVTCVYVDKPQEERKKRLVITNGATLVDSMFALFGISSSVDYILQFFDSEFSDWLDVDEPANLPPTGKLKLTICSG